MIFDSCYQRLLRLILQHSLKTMLIIIMQTSKDILTVFRQIFPSLKGRKGDNGRVAVIGGSYEFTGAPYYAALSSLKVGGDLAHIFCAKSAANAIKCYSPQVIVHPVFSSEFQVRVEKEQLEKMYEEWLGHILRWKGAIRSWVIGPGLGRDKYMAGFFSLLLKSLPEGALLVLDADAIYFLSQNPDLLPQLSRYKTILTPNHRELGFLSKIIKIDIDQILKAHEANEGQVIEFQGPKLPFTLVAKGQTDVIVGSDKGFIVRSEGSEKRCGGIGDLLSGAMAVCAGWHHVYGPPLACRMVRLASSAAFKKQGRSLTAPIVLGAIPEAVRSVELGRL